MSAFWGKVCFPALVLLLAPCAAEAPIQPITVCEALKELPDLDGKAAAVIGRFSFRSTGRWMSEEACESKPAPGAIVLADDSKSGPKPPQDFEINGETATRKWKSIAQHTKLHKFRFGTPDYDRWAIVYGRIEALKTPAAAGDLKASARLVYRGDGVVLFLPDDYSSQ